MNISGQYAAELDGRGWMEDVNNWHSIVKHLETALSWRPLDTDLLLRLARLYRWRAFDQRLSPKLARESHNIAIRYVRDACRRRPSWGLSWATLAVVKTAAGQIDQEMIMALNRAVILGPWERQVQHQIVVAGMQTWHRLPAATQRSVFDTIDRALRDARLSKFVLETAILNNWQLHLIPLLQKNEDMKRLFERMNSKHKNER